MLTIRSLSLDEKQLSELERVAKGEDRSVSYLVRQAINQYLKSKAAAS